MEMIFRAAYTTSFRLIKLYVCIQVNWNSSAFQASCVVASLTRNCYFHLKYTYSSKFQAKLRFSRRFFDFKRTGVPSQVTWSYLQFHIW